MLEDIDQKLVGVVGNAGEWHVVEGTKELRKT
jgi:hypothetical protein